MDDCCYTKRLVLLWALVFAPIAHAQTTEDESYDYTTGRQSQSQSRLPIPDPTKLTTEALMREVGAVKELFQTRLNAMDKAITLLQSNADKSPTIAVVNESVTHLNDLTDEKFAGIEKQFIERDTRTEQNLLSSKEAITAALNAAKEAVAEQNKSNQQSIDKSEAAFTKQIDQIALLFQTTVKATDDKIDDIKNRLTLIEGRSQTVETGTGYVLTVAGIGLSLGVLAVGIIGLYLRKQV